MGVNVHAKSLGIFGYAKKTKIMTIDKTKPVMVTGATGYVAGWLVKRLLEEGLTVHAAVRNPKNAKKIAHLEAIGKMTKGTIKYFKSDLLQPGSYTEAMEGCELVYHTASPFVLEVKDPQLDLIDPAVNGTKNVLDTANATASVKRVVVTSSVAAIYNDVSDVAKAPNGVLTEEVWNTGSSLDYQPYSYSKTLAERKAWEMAKDQSNWDLVTINPSFVMGPPLNPHVVTSETFSILKQLGDGTMKMGAPKMGVGVVDVRDVANAHFQAGFNPKAQGRYITSGTNTNFFEMGVALADKFGDTYPIPKKVLPKWVVMLVGPLTNKLFTWRYIRNNIDVPFNADNAKIKRELGVTFLPLQKTMEDAFQVLVNEKIV
jgi:nucleoside-diphosphate-sugar epimerase